MSSVPTGERQGAGPPSEAVLRALDLTVRRRVESLLSGEQPASALGVGTEIAQIRPYVPGDDVRRIAWSVTARTGEVHVREDVAERALTTWIVLDTSPSMSFGTADRLKSDVATGAVLALGHLGSRRGGRVGMLVLNGARTRLVPPRQGRAAVIGLLAAMRRDGGEPAEGAGATSLGPVLDRLGRVARRRSLCVVASDLRGPRDWAHPLLRLAARHEVLCLEVRDPREQSIPDVGTLWLEDPETRRQARVDTSDRVLRERFAEEAGRDRAEVADLVRRAGAEHCVLSTSGDWLRALARHLLRREGMR